MAVVRDRGRRSAENWVIPSVTRREATPVRSRVRCAAPDVSMPLTRRCGGGIELSCGLMPTAHLQSSAFVPVQQPKDRDYGSHDHHECELQQGHCSFSSLAAGQLRCSTSTGVRVPILQLLDSTGMPGQLSRTGGACGVRPPGGLSARCSERTRGRSPPAPPRRVEARGRPQSRSAPSTQPPPTEAHW